MNCGRQLLDLALGTLDRSVVARLLLGPPGPPACPSAVQCAAAADGAAQGDALGEEGGCQCLGCRQSRIGGVDPALEPAGGRA